MAISRSHAAMGERYTRNRSRVPFPDRTPANNHDGLRVATPLVFRSIITGGVGCTCAVIYSAWAGAGEMPGSGIAPRMWHSLAVVSPGTTEKAGCIRAPHALPVGRSAGSWRQ